VNRKGVLSVIVAALLGAASALGITVTVAGPSPSPSPEASLVERMARVETEVKNLREAVGRMEEKLDRRFGYTK